MSVVIRSWFKFSLLHAWTKMKPLFLLLLVASAANALCTRGPAPTITSLNQTCFRMIGATTLDYCAPTGLTGATGATGATGSTGATGPAPTVTPLNSSCTSISGVGSSVICGPTGPQGPAPTVVAVNQTCITIGGVLSCGFAGPAPTVQQINASCTSISGVGSSVICAQQGEAGQTPGGVTLVTTLTRTALQAAIDAVTLLPRGGIVQVTGDITSDGVAPIAIKDRVTLDFAGYTLKAAASSANIDLVGVLGVGPGPTHTLVSNALRGSRAVNITTTQAALYSVGDMVIVSGGVSPCGDQGVSWRDMMMNEVIAIDSSLYGTLTLRFPLGSNFLTANSASVARYSGAVVDAGLRNIILDGNSNTGATARLLSAFGCRQCVFENIKVQGTHSPTAGVVFADAGGLVFRAGLDNRFRDIVSESYNGGVAIRDISFHSQTAATISNVHSRNVQGYGPALQFVHESTGRDLYAANSKNGRGISIDACSDVDLYGLHSSNHLTPSVGIGVLLGFGTHHNKLFGVTTRGSTEGGLNTQGTGDCANTVHGLQSDGNARYQVNLASGSVNNVIYGNLGSSTDTLRFIDTGTNTVCSTGTDSLTMACTQPTSASPLSASSFPGLNMVATSRIDDTHLATTMRGSDGVVRYGITKLYTTQPLVLDGVARVDGIDFALTRAGVQAALNAVSTAGGGVVRLSGDVTTDGTAISIPIGVELDCQRYSLKMLATSTVYTMLGAPSGSVAGSYPIVANASMGSSVINVGAANSVNFAVGDMVLLAQCTINHIASISAGHMHHIVGVNTGTGDITLRNPLAYSCTTNRAITATRVRQALRSSGIRNCVLDSNGNSGVGSVLAVFLNQHRFVMDNVKLTGDMTTAGGGAMAVSGCIDCTFTNLMSESLTLAAGGRDWSWTACEGCIIDVLRSSSNSGFGPNIAQSHDCVISRVFTMHHLVRGFRVDVSSRIVINAMLSNGHTGSSGYGFFFSFGSHRNILNGLVAVGNGGIGLAYSQTGDDHNQVYGYLAHTNALTDIGITSPATNNFIQGNYEWVDSPTNSDLTLQNHIVRVGGTRGLVTATPQGPPIVATTDLRLYEVTTVRANNTHLIDYYRGSDGNVRFSARQFF
jgi:hypothetical protein